MSETDPLKVIRSRREVVTGCKREAGSSADECIDALMGCPPQPVCWQIYRSVSHGIATRKKALLTILYMGTDP